jgi:hypothetical protein
MFPTLKRIGLLHLNGQVCCSSEIEVGVVVQRN